MSITFQDIYRQTIQLWEETIDISDGMLVETKNSFKALGKERSAGTSTTFYSQELSRQWAHATEAVAEDSAFARIMVWTMYEMFHQQATRLFEQQATSFSPAAINTTEIEARYFKNLQEELSEEELAQYQRMQ